MLIVRFTNHKIVPTDLWKNKFNANNVYMIHLTTVIEIVWWQFNYMTTNGSFATKVIYATKDDKGN